MFWQVRIFTLDPTNISREMQLVIHSLEGNLRHIIEKEYGENDPFKIELHPPTTHPVGDKRRSDVDITIVASADARTKFGQFTTAFLEWFPFQAQLCGVTETYSLTFLALELNEVH